MSDEDLRLAVSIFADHTRDGVLDMAAAIEDDEMWERNRSHFHPEAEIKFIIPGDTGVHVMQHEFVGIEGLREGWRRWLEPWGSYRIVVDDFVDAGEGEILVMVTSFATMRGTDAEVPQSAATRTVVREGRVAAIHFYLDQQQARR